jgi:hypothetical protein
MVQTDGMALYDVPEQYKILEICQIAVKNNSRSLKYVPEYNKTYKLCLLAVQSNGMVLRYVPENFILDLYKMACQNNSLALEYIPYTILENIEVIEESKLKSDSKNNVIII